jgi:hypothetical protein
MQTPADFPRVERDSASCPRKVSRRVSSSVCHQDSGKGIVLGVTLSPGVSGWPLLSPESVLSQRQTDEGEVQISGWVNQGFCVVFAHLSPSLSHAFCLSLHKVTLRGQELFGFLVGLLHPLPYLSERVS